MHVCHTCMHSMRLCLHGKNASPERQLAEKTVVMISAAYAIIVMVEVENGNATEEGGMKLEASSTQVNVCTY